jgi:D-sedoheptulose 7-phosphate isomerase
MKKALSTDLASKPTKWLLELHESLQQTRCKIRGEEVSLSTAFEALSNELLSLQSKTHKLFWIGNGGSASICSHLSQDCINKLGVASFHFNDPSFITCYANDYGYENLFSRALTELAQEGDTLIGISSSGNSASILNAGKVAIQKKLRFISLSSFSEDNKLWNFPAEISFYLPTSLYGIAEVGHLALLHAAIETMIK